jgi:hypothetical protein
MSKNYIVPPPPNAPRRCKPNDMTIPFSNLISLALYQFSKGYEMLLN